MALEATGKPQKTTETPVAAAFRPKIAVTTTHTLTQPAERANELPPSKSIKHTSSFQRSRHRQSRRTAVSQVSIPQGPSAARLRG